MEGEPVIMKGNEGSFVDKTKGDQSWQTGFQTQYKQRSFADVVKGPSSSSNAGDFKKIRKVIRLNWEGKDSSTSSNSEDGFWDWEGGRSFKSDCSKKSPAVSVERFGLAHVDSEVGLDHEAINDGLQSVSERLISESCRDVIEGGWIWVDIGPNHKSSFTKPTLAIDEDSYERNTPKS
ncbi:hypothetical protein LWI28_006113 [Acer negundo]|uniref:Uncharacterized protein n=1 Tax=Acer negundo TaxID=4023 RepID=A0AAD5NWJ9_ACENE|nr:hypothetical protein LWI28_006113 [Acer negundo]